MSSVKEILSDPTLIGVIIGSLLSLIGNVIAQYFSARKDERVWERQRVSAKEEREEKSKERDQLYVRELYHKSLSALTAYVSKVQLQEESGETASKKEEIEEIHNWLSLLLLRHPSPKLDQLIRNFMFSPDWDDAERLRKEVLGLAAREEGLSSGISPEPQQEEIPSRTLSFQLNGEYRREQLVNGVELPQSVTCQYQLEDIAPEHRERLLRSNFETTKSIPNTVRLMLPHLAPGAKKINFNGKPWEACMNPNESSLKEILDAWVVEYDAYQARAEEEHAKA